jgi:signal transduction histidine kinase
MEARSCNLGVCEKPRITIFSEDIIQVNNSFMEMSGYSRNEILGKTISYVLNLLKINFHSILFKEKKESFLFTKSHEVRNVVISVKNSIYKNIKVYEFDEAVESRLEDKFPYLEKLSTDNDQGIAIYSCPDLILLKANEKYLETLEAPYNAKENSFGNRINEIINGFSNSEEEDMWIDAINNNKTKYLKKYRYIDCNGRKMCCDKIITPILEREALGYIVINNNNIMENDSEYVDDKDKYSNLCNIINTLDLPILTVSYPDLKIKELNNRAYCFLEALDEADNVHKDKIRVGEDILALLPTLYSMIDKACIQEIERTKSIKYINNIKLVLDGEVTYFNIFIQPSIDNGGKVSKLLMIWINVTEQVKQKVAMEKTLRIQSEFFSFISHEFKTPLNVTMSAVQAMKYICKDELTSRSLKYLNKIYTSALQQLRLVNNLLDITRAETGYLKVHKKNNDIVSMTKAIIDSVDAFAIEKDIALKFSTSIPELIIGIDDEKYERILLNLLSNAIKFTPKGKSITVIIALKDNNVSIKVKDQGIGIPIDKKETIFNKFEQVNNSLTRITEGTGIGLYLVKLLVGSLGGKISVKSGTARGSTFEVIFPLIEAAEQKQDGLSYNLIDDRLIQMTNIEFSNIYCN